MSVDTEMETWRREWQSASGLPGDVQHADVHQMLRKKVERQSLLMRFMLASDILVTVFIGGATTGWAIRSPQPDILLLAAMTWVFFAAAWAFSLSSNRGKWSPATRDTAAFLDISVRRCRGSRAALRFAIWLFVCDLSFCLAWIYHRHPAPRPPLLRWLLFSSPPIDIVWIASAALFVFLWWMRRKKRDEFAYLMSLREQLQEHES